MEQGGVRAGMTGGQHLMGRGSETGQVGDQRFIEGALQKGDGEAIYKRALHSKLRSMGLNW